jgi:Major tropism determinant N-terminal domain/Phage tail repeat like
MTTIRVRRGTAAQWSTANPILALGELGLETDTSKLKGGDGVTAWNSLDYISSAGGGGGGGNSWGSITGTISSQTDLQAALDGKADDAHSHVISDVTGLQTALDGKQPTGSYAASSHTHSISNITGLQTALDAKIDDTQFDGLAKITVGATAPSSPSTGDLWIDTN